MAKVNRIEHLKSLKKEIRMLYNIGYVRSHIFRDMEILEDYFSLLNDEYNIMESYLILSNKYKLTQRQISTIIRKLCIEC